MAGIKETKELLRKEILELHKNLSAVKPEWLFAREENKSQWTEYAAMAASLAKKIETLACLNTLEEDTPVIVPLPEIKMPESGIPGISFTHKDEPPVPEIKQPEIIPVIEKVTPPVPEVKQPEIIPPIEKSAPLVPEIKQQENIPVMEKITPPVPEVKIQEVVSPPPVAKNLPELKSFIGLNEKLMFQRSLFKGDGSAYENVLAQLNSCTSYKEAEAILKNLSFANKWSTEDEPVQVFYSIVKRRFA